MIADTCDRTEEYLNGMVLTIEEAIKGGDFQIEEYACKGCTRNCKKRIDAESKYGMKY